MDLRRTCFAEQTHDALARSASDYGIVDQYYPFTSDSRGYGIQLDSQSVLPPGLEGFDRFFLIFIFDETYIKGMPDCLNSPEPHRCRNQGLR